MKRTRLLLFAVIVSVLPKKVKLNHSPPDELSAEEIDQRIRAFQGLIDDS